MRRAAVIGAGSWGTAVAVLLARGGLEVQLATRTAAQAAEIEEARENRRYLEGVRLPDSVRVRQASEVELAGLDLVCLAIPSGSLPQAVGAIADKVGDRSAMLLLTKGLIAPLGQLPAEYVGERVRARAIACLGGPAHAREAVSGSAALVLGSADADLRDQLGGVFDSAGLVCERSRDVDRGRDGGRGEERRRPRRRRRRAATVSTRPGSPPPRSGASASSTRSAAAPTSRPSPAWPGSAT